MQVRYELIGVQTEHNGVVPQFDQGQEGILSLTFGSYASRGNSGIKRWFCLQGDLPKSFLPAKVIEFPVDACLLNRESLQQTNPASDLWPPPVRHHPCGTFTGAKDCPQRSHVRSDEDQVSPGVLFNGVPPIASFPTVGLDSRGTRSH